MNANVIVNIFLLSGRNRALHYIFFLPTSYQLEASRKTHRLVPSEYRISVVIECRFSRRLQQSNTDPPPSAAAKLIPLFRDRRKPI